MQLRRAEYNRLTISVETGTEAVGTYGEKVIMKVPSKETTGTYAQKDTV